jgi:hypothetical protein
MGLFYPICYCFVNEQFFLALEKQDMAPEGNVSAAANRITFTIGLPTFAIIKASPLAVFSTHAER